MNKNITIYLLCYLVLLFVVLGLLYSYPKAELHLLLNACHNGVWDVFFRWYSVLAEWPLYVIALIPLAFKHRNWTLFYAISEGIGALVIRIIKIAFHAPRPVVFFEQYPDIQLPLVDGVRMHHSNSFPSGHTSTFFIFFTFSALLLAHYYSGKKKDGTLFSNRIVQQLSLFLLLVMAAVGGYSRIYLSQHFLSDVCVGSIVGVIVPCVMFSIYGKKITR